MTRSANHSLSRRLTILTAVITLIITAITITTVTIIIIVIRITIVIIRIGTTTTIRIVTAGGDRMAGAAAGGSGNTDITRRDVVAAAGTN